MYLGEKKLYCQQARRLQQDEQIHTIMRPVSIQYLFYPFK